MCNKYLYPIGLSLLAYHVVQITSRVELTNLKCIPLDKTFADFENCRIKSLNRTYKYISVRAKLFKTPVTNVTINIALLKRFNDYKPFLYNITFDGCRFLSSKNRNPMYNLFYSFIRYNSNMNHSCPYDHDLIVDKITVDFLNHQFSQVLPIPSGDYAIFTSWYAYGINRADVRIYGTLS